MKISVIDVVLAVAGGLCLREGDPRAFPPQRVSGEVEDSGQPSHVGNGRTERRCDHLQRGDVYLAELMCWIFQSNERKNPVDFVEGEFLLVSVRDPENL